jgi:hypothetical protein
MSYEEKGTWVYLVTTVVTYVAYVVIILGRARGGHLTDVHYASTMLWTIGISIASTIVGRVAVETARPSDRHKADARDREINRFGDYIGGIVLAVAMVVPLVLTMAEAPYFWIANAMYTAFVLSAVASSPVKLIAYRWGL